MKKILVVLALFVGFQMSAQKISLVSGDIKDLKGVSSLDVEFVWSEDMHVGKMTEKDYIAKRMKEEEAKETGNGEKWKTKYIADREEHFAPQFLKLFNDVLAKKGMDARENNNDAKIKMVVTTTFIEPGFNIGISSRPAYANFEVVFIDIESGTEFAKYKIMKSPGTAYFDYGVRVGEAYAKGAKYFAKLLLKKKAF